MFTMLLLNGWRQHSKCSAQMVKKNASWTGRNRALWKIGFGRRTDTSDAALMSDEWPSLHRLFPPFSCHTHTHTRAVATGGRGMSVYIPPPPKKKNQSTLQIFMWLLVAFSLWPRTNCCWFWNWKDQLKFIPPKATNEIPGYAPDTHGSTLVPRHCSTTWSLKQPIYCRSLQKLRGPRERHKSIKSCREPQTFWKCIPYTLYLANGEMLQGRDEPQVLQWGFMGWESEKSCINMGSDRLGTLP